MKFKKINGKRLTRKVFEDGIKKSLELVVLGVVIGLTFDRVLLTLGAVIGGSLYRKSNQIDFI